MSRPEDAARAAPAGPSQASDRPHLILRPMAAPCTALPATRTQSLAETVDHLIARGLVLQGEIALAVAGTELVRLDLSAVLRAALAGTQGPDPGENRAGAVSPPRPPPAEVPA